MWGILTAYVPKRTLLFIDVSVSLGDFVTKISQGVGNQAFFAYLLWLLAGLMLPILLKGMSTD